MAQTLHARPAQDHIVQFYENDQFLADAVCHFLDEGLRAGQGAVVIATADHWRAFAAALEVRGHDVIRAIAEGRLAAIDADEMLARLTESGHVDRGRFQELIGTLIDQLVRERPAGLRAYGEMVDILTRRGQLEDALQLEDFWNELMHARSLTLLCAYLMGGFDPAAQGLAFQSVRHAHDRVLACEGSAEAVGAPPRTVQLDALQSVTAALSGSVRMTDVAAVVAGRGLDALGASAASVYFLNHDGRSLRHAASRGVDVATLEAIRTIPLDSPRPLTDAVRTGEPVWLPDRETMLARYPAIRNSPLPEARLQSVIALPLKVGDRTLGGMAFSFARAMRPDAEQRDFVATLAHQCAQALERCRLYETERDTRQRLAILAEAGELLASSLDWETTLQNVIGLTMPAFADFGFFDVVEDDGRVRRISRAHQDPRRQALLEATSWRKSERADLNLCALSSGRAGVHADVDAAWVESAATGPEHLALIQALDFGSMVTVPLLQGERRLGALTLFHAAGGRRHSQPDVVLIEEIARRAASAVENARLHRQLQDAVRRREDADRRKDEFLAMLGHELRNPLSPVLTALQLMKVRPGTGAERERAIIERQVRHMGALVDDLLDVSRITRGKVVLRRQPVEVAAVLARAIEMASPLLEQRGHALTLAVPRDGLAVEADQVRLAQVFSNLLTNAAKYTEPQGRIHVAAWAEGGSVVVSCEDNGIGIPADMLPGIFELFWQGERPLDRAQGGLGLGLALARSLTELHGGTVVAESDGAGQGSRFVVRLPHLAAPPGPADAPAVAHESVAPRRRILVVDDNADAAEMLAAALRLAGHEVAVAGDGPEALALARTFRPTTAVLDVGLPVMDGYELARRLRAELDDRAPRLVALTGYGMERDLELSRKAGFDVHLVKPVDFKVLLAHIAPPDPTTAP